MKTKQKKIKKVKAWAILYSKKKGGLCHYDDAFNDMPSIYFHRKTALYHAQEDRDLVVPVIITYKI